MKTEKYDVLQTFLLYGNLIGQSVGALAGIPVRVSSQRNRNDNYSWLARFLDRVVANSRVTQKMVAVCEANRRYCIDTLRISDSKLVTVRNGIAPRQCADDRTYWRAKIRSELGLDERQIAAAVVARLHPQKGHGCLLEAIRSLGPLMPDLRILLVGDGPLRGELTSFIQRHDLSAFVRLLGNRQDVADILCASDLFVLPSLWEGLPNAVLEAMAASLPVVATDVDGTSELVVPDVTGILVAPGDSIALADAISDLAANTDKRREMGKAGRKRVEQDFTLTKFIESFEELYSQLDKRIREQ